MNKELSKCCNAPVKVVGKTTLHYECKKCGKPCDLNKMNKKWEEKFDEAFKSEEGGFDDFFTRGDDIDVIKSNDPRYYEKVKSFIQSLLDEQREELKPRLVSRPMMPNKTSSLLLDFLENGKKGRSVIYTTKEGNFLSPKAVENALKQQREEAFKEIYLVIEMNRKEFGIEKEWDDKLHPVDILDKYVFPVLVSREEIVGEIEGMKRMVHGDESSKTWKWGKEEYNQAISDILNKLKDI